MYVTHRFHLSEETKGMLREIKAPFGYNGFGELMYYSRYSRLMKDGSQEHWPDTVIRVVEGVFSIRRDWYIKTGIQWAEDYWQRYARDFAISFYLMKWMPPGRGLWAMGSDFVYERGAMALYNCFSGDTEFYGNGKLLRLSDLVDCEVTVLTKDKIEKKAIIKSFGIQKLQTIVFKPSSTINNGQLERSNLRVKIRATKNHRWILPNGEVTTDLKVGNCVQIKTNLSFKLDKQSQSYIDGYCHGLIYGDGTQQTAWPDRFTIRLCKDEIGLLRDTLERCSLYRSTCQPPSYGGDYVIILVTAQRNLKLIPETNDLNYVRGFFDAWLEADSYETPLETKSLASSNSDAIEWAIKIAPLVGYVSTGISWDERETNYGPRTKRLNLLKIRNEDCFYRVCAIIDEGHEEEVFCVIEPETHSFTLAGGIPTGNCAFTNITDDMGDDLAWAMDSLMHGVGVGFSPVRNDGLKLYSPHGYYDFEIPDTREGWVESVKQLIYAYQKPRRVKPRFIYDRIRPFGLPIKGFGGIASGPEPLVRLHNRIEESCERYQETREYDSVRLKADLMNHAGCCVVAGNVRRSAELACGPVHDKTFMDLKDYEKYPERREYGWMSNNSAILESDFDFQMLGEIAKRVITRGEPGYINLRNLKYGRIGKRDRVRKDEAVGFNPCGEIPLEHREVCNVAETMPTVCNDEHEWFEGCEHATFYCSTVSLLPTHQPSTNKVVARNRRIGVSITDVSGWKHLYGVYKVTAHMRQGYKIVCETNRNRNAEAGVPEAIRKTTIKPGGTIPKLPGKTPGAGNPTFDYTIRRFRQQEGSPVDRILEKAGYPREADTYSLNTVVFEFPILQGPAKPAAQVSLWEQAMTLVWVQREWADNAVSNTLYFRPKWPKIAEIKDDFEENLSLYTDLNIHMEGQARKLLAERRDVYETEAHRFVFDYMPSGILQSISVFQFDSNHEEDAIEPVLSAIAPLTKSVSLLPHSSKGAYAQMPEEGIDKSEYNRRLSELQIIDWTNFGGSDGMDDRYCDGDRCVAT